MIKGINKKVEVGYQCVGKEYSGRIWTENGGLDAEKSKVKWEVHLQSDCIKSVKGFLLGKGFSIFFCSFLIVLCFTDF